MRALSVLIVALVLVPILQAQAGEAEEGTMLMALDAKFDAQVAARGVDAWVSFFAPNGIQGRGDRPPVVGHAAIREHMTDYYAMFTHLDDCIGRVVQTLKETGEYDNTIILMAGDNGLAVGRHGLMGKQNLYEHSVRVPLILAGPGVPKGERRDAFCYLLDIFPTLCGLAGVTVPDTVEGLDLRPLLDSADASVRDDLLLAYCDVQRGVRERKWKLIEYCVNGRRTTQLFDVEEDPHELHNRADDPGCAEHLERLRGKLLRWRDELDDASCAFWETFAKT